MYNKCVLKKLMNCVSGQSSQCKEMLRWNFLRFILRLSTGHEIYFFVVCCKRTLWDLTLKHTQSHNNLTGHQISDGLKGIIQARKWLVELFF